MKKGNNVKKVLSIIVIILVVTAVVIGIYLTKKTNEKNESQNPNIVESNPMVPQEQNEIIENKTWPTEEWVESIPEYKKGNIKNVTGEEDLTVNVVETTYEDYLEYINELKNKGFSHYDITGQGASENITLDSEFKSAVWMASDGDVYIIVTYIANDSPNMEQYNANIRMYIYKEKPESWQ